MFHCDELGPFRGIGFVFDKENKSRAVVSFLHLHDKWRAAGNPAFGAPGTFGNPALNDLDLFLFDSNGRQLTKSDSGRSGQGEWIPILGIAAGILRDRDPQLLYEYQGEYGFQFRPI